MKISICINTYKRPELLLKLLESINEQILEGYIELEINVVDNSPEKEGIEQVVNFEPHAKHSIKYAEQPIKNISITRNKAVSMATGEFICFVDDDEYADNHWIQNLYNCLIKYKADGVFGKVVPYYDLHVPNFIKEGRFFNQIDQSTGDLSKSTYTNNAMIKADLVNQFEEPFLEAFGKTGGEDVNFFTRLKQQGAIFIHCNEAIVYDFVPFSRANLNWLKKRSYRSGITSTENKINKAENQLLAKIYYLIKYIIFFTISFFLTIIYLFSKQKRIYWYLKCFGNIGHLASIFGLKYEEYK